MKKIILQHWTGEMDELGILSSANITKYAEKINADYKLLRGNVFHSKLTPQTQKLFMLDESFDEYDMVVMLDIDIFTRKGMEEDIFEDIDGIGMNTEFQVALRNGLKSRMGDLFNLESPYWGGAVYRLNQEMRYRLRAHLDLDEMLLINKKGGNDEAIMHRLGSLAKVENSALPGEYKWCHCSYRDGIEDAALIHIRTKITPTGPKRTKIENYRDLIKRGLI